MLPIAYASFILILVLRFLFNLSRRRADIVLAGIRDILRLANVPPEQLNRVPHDSRSVLGRFHLDPVTRTYVMCPQCYALYPLSTTQRNCTFQATEQSEVCGAAILRSTERGADTDAPPMSEAEHMEEGQEGGRGGHYMPIKTYTHQSFKHWLASVLCRPGVEEIVDDYPRIFSQKDNIEDIWDTPFMRSFPDYSQPPQEASTFFSPAMEREGRYAFSLSVDSFNPHGNVTAKHTVSATGINMVLLNFPPHLRHKVENFYYAGVIPGPGKPSNEQINHFVQLIVDEFGPFYEEGVTYSKTAKYPNGRSCKCILAILVTDALAARQVAGFRSVTSYYPCTFCWVTIHDLETLTRPWHERQPAQHREYAEEWKTAQDPGTRKKVEDMCYIRWSPLLQLHYWNPCSSTVVDSMHNLYLGALQDHCREIWGISTQHEGGDGVLRPKVIHQRPSSQIMSSLLETIRTEIDMPQLLTKLCKRTVPLAALWYICLDYGLRRDGNQYKLARRIVNWASPLKVVNNPFF